MGPPARLLLRPFLPTQAVFAQVSTVFLYRTTRDISGKNCHNLGKVSHAGCNLSLNPDGLWGGWGLMR